MKIRNDMILRQVGKIWAVFPIGAALTTHNSILQFNETGAFLFNALTSEQTIESLSALLQQEYDIDYETAYSATEGFVHSMERSNLFDEQKGKPHQQK